LICSNTADLGDSGLAAPAYLNRFNTDVDFGYSRDSIVTGARQLLASITARGEGLP